MSRLMVTFLYSLILLLVPSTVLASPSLQDLIETGDVGITAYINQSAPFSVGEKVVLSIDITTSTWFTKGTQVSHFEVPGALVLANNSSTINSMLHKKGKTYSNQVWEFPIFAQSSGEFIIPPITVEIEVKHKDEKIAGKLITPVVIFEAQMPSPYVTDDTQWLVGESVTLSASLEVSTKHQSSIDSDLHVGDVIHREVIVRGENTTSMLMPQLLVERDYQHQNTRAYLKNSERSDVYSRGEGYSQHIERVDIIVTGAGELTLPEISLLWRDPTTQTETRLSLPTQTWKVEHTLWSFIQFHWVISSVVLIATMISLFGTIWGWRYFRHLERMEKTPLIFQFWKAIRKNEFGHCETVLYRKVKRKHGKDTLLRSNSSGKFQQDVHQYQCQKYQFQTKGRTTVRQLWKIWQKI